MGLRLFERHSHFSRLARVQTLPLDLLSMLQVILKMSKGVAPDRIVVIGHSLGGAVAQLAALWATLQFPRADVRAITFGSPRVGNKAFKVRVSPSLDWCPMPAFMLPLSVVQRAATHVVLNSIADVPSRAFVTAGLQALGWEQPAHRQQVTARSCCCLYLLCPPLLPFQGFCMTCLCPSLPSCSGRSSVSQSQSPLAPLLAVGCL